MEHAAENRQERRADAVKVGDTIYVTIQVNPNGGGTFNYAYLYFGTRTELAAQLEVGGAFDVVAGVDEGSTQSYHFTLPASAAGTRIPICTLKTNNKYNSNELELVIPSNIP